MENDPSSVFGDLDPAKEPSPETTAPESGEPPATANKTGMSELEEARLEAANWKEVALRAAAELDNFRKRVARERQEAVRFANSALLETLLPVLDNFEFGLQAARAESETSSVFIGMSMVHKQLQDFLREQGVEEIPAVGLPFDPNVHDAVSQEPSADTPEGIILSQKRRGYRLRDRLLRPASVVVATTSASA
ncbi:MAG: nucleotide exchange factor GrpE [Verrucomicrobiales bacterium]|nr:nucleotide exchange factor GrpE [Verrucomicrobiales bacterium]